MAAHASSYRFNSTEVTDLTNKNKLEDFWIIFEATSINLAALWNMRSTTYLNAYHRSETSSAGKQPGHEMLHLPTNTTL